MLKKKVVIGIALLFFALLVGAILFLYNDSKKIGHEIDSYKGIPVYYNGIFYTQSHGKSFSKDGYFFGYQWQCIEYVKRFYKEVKGHKMPDMYGNSKDYFDADVPQGQLNGSRDLIQYRNGGNEKPQPDDLIIFNDTKYGHVSIITAVTEDYIEVIQQNVYGKPRARYDMKWLDGNWFVGSDRKPAGWLRIK